jgi:hypothetical protein
VVSRNPFEQTPEQKARAKRLRWVAFGVGAVLVIASVGYLEFAPKPKIEEIALTAEAKGYIRNLKLDNVEMKAKLDYFSQKVVEVQGQITNGGDRKLNVVEVTCVFRDYRNQVILRQRAPIVSAKMGGLQPGETKQFRLPFDEIPASWNQQLPNLVIAGIDFE